MGLGRGLRPRPASVTDDLRELLSLTPSFRLLVAHGYSDMVTPYAVSRYVLDHLPPIGEPARTQLSLYRGGHMFYIDAESRKAFSADAKEFYQSSSDPRRSFRCTTKWRARNPQSGLRPGIPGLLAIAKSAAVDLGTVSALNSRISKPTWRSTT